MSTLVYVHGTNGSGKSTLARAVLAAGGLWSQQKVSGHHLTWLKKTTVMLGKYASACGGVDGIQPFEDMHKLMQYALKMGVQDYDGVNVFAEGLVTPGKDTCIKFASYFDQSVFVLLDTPETICIANVLKRRAAKGNVKPYSADNLYRKAKSARSWADNLERAGLCVERLQYKQAYNRTLELLGLPEPSVDDLL